MPQAEKRRIESVEVFTPRVQVRFHTESNVYEVEAKKRGTLGAEETLVSCQTYKDISQPAGTFIVHLADFARYDRLLAPMDLCTIKMPNHTPYDSRNGNLTESRNRITHATMIGLIDSVRRKRLIDPNTGRPNVFCEVRGRDLGKLLVKHHVRYIPLLQGQTEGEKIMGVVAMFRHLLSGFATGGPIDFLVANNLRKFFSESVDVSFPFNGRTVNLQNALSYRAMKRMGVIPYNLPLMAQEGSLWQILQNYANLPFNELWVDTINAPERVIPEDQASTFSSPLTSIELSSARAAFRQYVQSQTGKDRELSERTFGANAEKLGLAEKFLGSPDNSNAYTMLFFRRAPFDDRDWKALPRITIRNSDILEQDVGTSDDETYNMFWVYPLLAIPGEIPLKGLGVMPMMMTRERQFATVPDPGKANGYPRAISLTGTGREAIAQRAIARRNAVEKFGFNPLEVKTRVWRWAHGKQLKNSISTANLLTLALANWHKHNSILKQGSLTIKGIPDLHVGQRLYNADEDEEFYVEAVSNNYVQYQPLTATVMVTRGHRPGSIDWGSAYTEYCDKMPLKAGDQEEDI